MLTNEDFERMENGTAWHPCVLPTIPPTIRHTWEKKGNGRTCSVCGRAEGNDFAEQMRKKFDEMDNEVYRRFFKARNQKATGEPVIPNFKPCPTGSLCSFAKQSGLCRTCNRTRDQVTRAEAVRTGKPPKERGWAGLATDAEIVDEAEQVPQVPQLPPHGDGLH